MAAAITLQVHAEVLFMFINSSSSHCVLNLISIMLGERSEKEAGDWHQAWRARYIFWNMVLIWLLLLLFIFTRPVPLSLRTRPWRLSQCWSRQTDALTGAEHQLSISRMSALKSRAGSNLRLLRSVSERRNVIRRQLQCKCTLCVCVCISEITCCVTNQVTSINKKKSGAKSEASEAIIHEMANRN